MRFSTSLPDETLSCTPHHPQSVPLHASFHTALVVAEDPGFTASAILPPVLKIWNFEQIEYKADFLRPQHPAQTAGPTSSDNVGKPCNMVLEGRKVNDFDSFSAAEKTPPSDCLLDFPPVVDGKPAVPLRLADGSHGRAMCTEVDDFGVGLASLTQEARMQLWFTKEGTSVKKKDMTFTLQMLVEGSSKEKLLHFSDYLIIAIRRCRLFIQDRAFPNARDISVAELLKEIQQPQLLGNTESPQISLVATVSVCFASSLECYRGWVCACKRLSHKEVSLKPGYSTSDLSYKAPFNEEVWTVFLAFCTLARTEKMQSFDNYRTKFYNAAFALLEEVRGAASAANRIFCNVLMTEVFLSGFEARMIF